MTKPQRRKDNSKAFLYPWEVIKIYDIANDNQKYTLNFLLNTGARINEARHVDFKDLDAERKTIILRITKIRARLKETRPTPRIIPVSTKFFNYLIKNIKKYKIMSTSATRKMLHKYCREINTKHNYLDISAHSLRKTFGSWMLALNVDGFKLSQMLGNSPDELRLDYASPDIFNLKDKDIMREFLDDLPSRMRN